MQEWRSQAHKNNLDIKENGKCQLCEAQLTNGISQCVDISNYIAHKLNHDEGVKSMTIFICVDAHALQHAEIHGRWNNHFHLTRLNLILNENIKWNYKLSPLLSEVVNEYKVSRLEERIVPPMLGKRGQTTVVDVYNTSNDEEYIKMAYRWAREVYNSFENGHEIVEELSKIFKTKLNISTTN